MSEENDKSKKQSQKGNMKLPEANFAQLVLLFGTQAMQQLGLSPNPLSGKIEIDLKVAKFNIDLLNVLQEKTKGNLSENEDRMLEDLLFDLRMQYVKAIKNQETK